MYFEQLLYGLEKNGDVKVWNIKVKTKASDDSVAVIEIEHGKEGGKQQTKIEYVTEGKQGRNSYEQAVNEAKSRIKKNIDKGYRETVEELTDLPVLAMLAKDHTKVGKDKDIEKGVYTSDKLDGIRLLAFCVLIAGVKTILLKSRTGQLQSIPHIEQELLGIMEVGEIFDGEAYVHGPVLQDINSAVQRTDTQAKIDEAIKKVEKARYAKNYDEEKHKKASAELENAYLIHELRPQLQFHVFDVVDLKLAFTDRLELLREAGTRFRGKYVVEVKYKTATSIEELTQQLKDCISRGYEGIMYRFGDGMYESGKRSSGLFKFKLFVDEEFMILRTHKDKQGYVVFELLNNLNDEEFNCVMGDYDWRLAVADDDFSNQWMTVKYQARNKGTLIPQFGTGKVIREGTLVNGEFIPSV